MSVLGPQYGQEWTSAEVPVYRERGPAERRLIQPLSCLSISAPSHGRPVPEAGFDFRIEAPGASPTYQPCVRHRAEPRAPGGMPPGATLETAPDRPAKAPAMIAMSVPD
jgi:hypothetical protein